MKGICIGKGIVIGIDSIFGLFGHKTRSSCIDNKTAEKYGSFSSFIVRHIVYKILREYFIGSVGCVVSGSDTSCHSVFD